MPTPSPALSDRDVRLWSMLCHLSALAGLLVPTIGSAVGPLVVWLIRRHDHPDIDAHGRESLNFQLSILIYCWALGILGILTTFILVGFVFLAAGFVVGIVGLGYAILAAVRTSNGETFKYPFSIRFF